MEKKLQVFGSSICGFEGMYQNLISFKCASGSGVEHHLAKVGAAGSNPVSRFFYFLKILVLQDLLFLCIKMKKQAPKNLPFMVQ